MSKYHYLLDAGHGGLINDVYQTATKWWKRSYFKDGELLSAGLGTAKLEKICDEKFYEGIFNREIRDLIAKKLDAHCIEYSYINSSESDMPLSQIVYTANKIAANMSKRTVFFSIHSNAGGGTGIEIYTSEGYTKADPIGQILAEELHTQFDEKVFRKDLRDGDWDKEKDFYVLKYTAMPAVLSENFFYDNYNDFKFISEQGVKEEIAEAHVNAILRIEKEISL